MRASELTKIFEAEGGRTFWYLSGETYPGHYSGSLGGYRSYIMPANAKSVYTRKELTPLDFDPQTCVFTDPSNGMQYIAVGHDNYDGQDISKLNIVPYPIKPNMRKPFDYPPNDGKPYDANAEYRQKAEAFKPTVLELWHELQMVDWAKVDAKVDAWKAKQAAKHPVDTNGIRIDNAAGQTLLAIAAEPNKAFRSDDLGYGNGGTMSNAFHKLRQLGYAALGKSGTYTTVKITPAGIEAATYLGSNAGGQSTKSMSAAWKRKDSGKAYEYLYKLDIPSNLDFLEQNRDNVMMSLQSGMKDIQRLKKDLAEPEFQSKYPGLVDYYTRAMQAKKQGLSKILDNLERGGFKLNLPPDFRNQLIKSKLG